MACTDPQLDINSCFLTVAKKWVGPAYYGQGLNPTPGQWQQYALNFSNPNTGYYAFIYSMWNHYQQFGCNWFQNRVNHWNHQLQTMNLNAYHTNRKLAKIAYVQELHICCGCSGPIPI